MADCRSNHEEAGGVETAAKPLLEPRNEPTTDRVYPNVPALSIDPDLLKRNATEDVANACLKENDAQGVKLGETERGSG